MPTVHATLTTDELHLVWRQVFANEAARLADATSYSAGDVGHLARQTDTGEVYVLTATTPTWTRLPTLIADAVIEAFIANGAVTSDKIGADAVDGTKIADEAVDSEHYVDGSIDPEHLSTTVATVQDRVGGYPVSAGDTTYDYWYAPWDATVVGVVLVRATTVADTSITVDADPFGTPTTILSSSPTSVSGAAGISSGPAISGTTYDIAGGAALRIGITGGGSASGGPVTAFVVYKRR